MPTGWTDGRGQGVSNDGAVVAGTLFGQGRRAFRWTHTGGTVLLDLPAGIVESDATAISNDGSTVVGWAADAASVNQPFRWTTSGGMQLLGHLPTFPGPPTAQPQQSQATGVTADGSVIIGNEAVTSPVRDSVPFIWDEAHGMRDLTAVLASDYGLALPGWTLWSANGITPDGMTIVGMGSHPEFGPNVAWRVVLPEPGTGAAVVGMVCLSLRRRRRA
jgi:probable HAF family extracellular repeat protein